MSGLAEIPAGERFVLLSDNFAVPERDLCMHRPGSPDADFRCIAVKDHKGAHQHCWSPPTTIFRPDSGITFARASA